VIARFLIGPSDPIRLDTFRVAFGVTLIAYMTHWWLDDPVEWLTVAGFHLAPADKPGWLPFAPMPLEWLAPFTCVFFGVLVAFVVGWRLPWTAALSLLLLLYVSHVDPLASFTPNNLFIVGLAVLTVAPAGSYWRLGGPPPRSVSAWPLRILQATLVLIYFTAGTCKVFFGDWLSDSHVLWSNVAGPYRTDLAAWFLRELPRWAWTMGQALSLSFELVAPLLFARRRLRPLAYVWGGAMHLGIALTMNEIGYLSLQMLCFYLLFVDVETLHRWRDRIAPLSRLDLLRLRWPWSTPDGPSERESPSP
jgi:hypothetical protein